MGEDTGGAIGDPASTDPVKTALYLLRGEIVSVGGAVEWTIGHLSAAFAGPSQGGAKRQWGDVKRTVRSIGLLPRLEGQVQEVGHYFGLRNLAAPSMTNALQVAEATQIIRVANGGQSVEMISLAELGAERDQVRRSHQALQEIGRALDDAEPGCLAHLNSILRMILMGRL